MEESLNIILRNDETIISSISVTDIVFDVYLGKWNYRAIPKVKTWSYFLTIPKLTQNDKRMGITEISDVNVSLVNNILLSILWFNEPDFAERYKVGSICYFLVDIDIKETGYIGLSVIGTCVIPVLLMDDIDFYDDQELSEWL